MTVEEIQKSTELQTLIAECTAYDFKVMLEEGKPKSWLKSVSAFANGLGGSLFFGVDNDGNVKGLIDIQTVGEKISKGINDRMDPLPDVEMIPWRVDGQDVLELKVNVGSYTPYYYVGDGQRVAFVRKGSQSVPATAEEMVRLVLKGSNRTFDSLRTDKRKEDHSFVMLANTFKERTGQDWDKKYLLSFGLVTDNGYLTNAGALFADDCWLSQSRLYCTRWDGLEKGDALNDAEFKGNVLLLLREAMAFAKASTRKGWEKLPNGRKNKPEYAERAVLEACVNHFIHRDYTVMGGEVHLDIYDDRIVVTSPGGMYSGQQVQDVPIEEISSNRRNPVLADVMAQLDYMEKRGSGLKRICNETMALDGYRDELKPLFKSSPSQFITVIYSVEYKDAGKDTGKDAGKDTGKDVMAISKPDIYVLKLLKEVGSKTLTVKDMMEKLDLKGPDNFRKKYLNPAIKGGYIALLYPDKPRKKGQAYYLTELGKALLERTQ